MSKILITGANGFIGSFLVEEALKQGHDVYAAVRSSSNLKYLKDYRIHILTLDLGNPEKLREKWTELKKYITGFDYVIHNAGATQVVDTNDFEKVNNQYTQNLLQSLIDTKFSPRKFILMSSLAAQGPGNAETLKPIETINSPKPITAYGKSKLKAEQYLTAQQDVPYLIFRPTAVYGPREKDFLTFFKTINRHLEPYISSPKQQLSFIYVKDLARLLIKSTDSTINNGCFLASDGDNYTCKQFADISKKALGKWTLPLIFPKSVVKGIALLSEKLAQISHSSSVLNSDKYKELTSLNWGCNSAITQIAFDFTPEYKLKQGVKEAIQWYKNNNCL